jgi:acetylglutamate kinase
MSALSIIKIGGDIIDDRSQLEVFLRLVADIKTPKIIVHGGGKLVTQLANKLGLPQEMIDGRRITDAETLNLATMVYAGLINKTIVAQLQAQGNSAVGLSGTDNNCIKAQKRQDAVHDFGLVGDIIENGVNTDFISSLLEQGICPVFCSITHDNQGQLFNTNADTLAAELAIALSKTYQVTLSYCFNKKGVMLDINDDNSVISTFTAQAYKDLKAAGIVSQGMIPKLDNAFRALQSGLESVSILHADDILSLQTPNNHAGTTLIA